MSTIHAEIMVDEIFGDDAGTGCSYDGDATARLSNPDAENGYEVSGPLFWLNSARVTTDPEDDAVHCVVSVGDPRGGFCFTVRRIPSTGQLVIHLPHPGEGMAHVKTAELHPGTLGLIHDDGRPFCVHPDAPEGDEDSEDES